MQIQDPLRRQNSTPVTSFVLAAYFNPGSLRWLFFWALLLLYLLMVFSNVLLLCVIALNRSLHEPMYMFLCSLFVNEVYGSTALLPFLLVNILRDDHVVSAAFCFFQIFAVHGYGNIELLTLVSMSYDRYVAICDPFHYSTRMTCSRTAVLIFLPWTFAFFVMGIVIGFTLPLELCSNTIEKVYCNHYPVVRLACYDTFIINIFAIVSTFYLVICPFIVIMYTYSRILKVCWHGSGQTRRKAMNTCAPHLASILNFTVAAFFELFQGQINMTHFSNMFRIFLSVYFLLCQPLFNPLIYGLVLTKIRLICKDLLLRVFRIS